MAAGHTQGALQPSGIIAPEPTFEATHVAASIVYIASLPLSVTVLDMNIMWVPEPIPRIKPAAEMANRASTMPFVGRG